MTRSPHVSINLRMPPELHKKIVELAAGRKPPRSLNSEIVGLLMYAIQEQTVGPFTDAQLEAIAAILKRAGLRKK